MRYWTFGLLGVAISSAAVAVVAWCTYALTRVSLCTPEDGSLGCARDTGQLGIAIALAIFLAIPIGSKLFARRRRPRGSVLGPLALGLAITAAGGAALWSALGSAGGTGTAEAVGYAVGATLLSIGPFVLFGGLFAVGSRGDANAARIAELQANGYRSGEIAERLAAEKAAAAGVSPVQPSPAASVGTLAAQLSAIAAARARASGDDVATRLRRLDDLRASGLLSPAEHAAKRAEILSEI